MMAQWALYKWNVVVQLPQYYQRVALQISEERDECKTFMQAVQVNSVCSFPVQNVSPYIIDSASNL